MKKALFIALFLVSTSLFAQWQPAEWKFLKHYDKEHLYNISLPLGGIGTGTVGLGGRGELRDWEIMNKPSVGYSTVKKGSNLAPFFSIWVKQESRNPITKALIGPVHPAEYLSAEGSGKDNHGLPRFANASFDAAYPLGQVSLSDDELPLKIKVKAFNPLIPADADASSIPIAVLSYEVENTSNEAIEVAVCGLMNNFVGQDGSKFWINWKGEQLPTGAKSNENEFRENKDIKGIYMYSDSVEKSDAAFGTIALTTNSKEGTLSYRTTSYPNGILGFWNQFSKTGVLSDEKATITDNPTAALAVKKTIPARSTKVFTFFITWNFPNRLGWVEWEKPNHDKTVYGNYYSTLYTDAWDVAAKTIPQLPLLESKTVAFVNAVLESSIPDVVKEAALFNLNALRSQTTFRLPSGHLMGWEGTMDNTGSCMGSCTHVWNYEQATAFLFGKLALTMRDVEFNYATNEKGAMSFRVQLPLNEAVKKFTSVAADGQMGCVMKFYRDWQLSGDNELLAKNWTQVKMVMAYAWVEKGWDGNQDGVMEGRQHNTMDVDYFGPNPQMQLWYLGALKASAEMAKQMKDKAFEKKCNRIYKQGSQWTDLHLFNGEYYEHLITNPKTFEFINMNSDTVKIPGGQLGRGCLVDQLVGQYMADICNLGYLVKEENIRTTLQSILKYNYQESFDDHFNNARSYVFGNESGLLMASWPNGRLENPFPYFAEVMTGFEYTAATSMLYEGFTSDALKCISAVRQRFDGYKRNPFSEPECGHHYARSMASWATLLAITDFHYSGVKKSMSIASQPGIYFWSNGYAWGTCKVDNNTVTLNILHGQIELLSFELKNRAIAKLKDFKMQEGESRTIEF